MSLARDIAQFIQDQGIATFATAVGWTIAIDREAKDPPECITIYETGGDDPDTDELDIRSSFQLRFRARSYEDAWGKAVACRDALILASRPNMNGNIYAYVFSTSGITSLGRDDTDRFILVANYRTMLERT